MDPATRPFTTLPVFPVPETRSNLTRYSGVSVFLILMGE